MRWEKKLAKPTKTDPGRRKNKIVRYVFISTIILSLIFSLLITWLAITDNLGQGSWCRSVHDIHNKDGIYFVINGAPCVLTLQTYFSTVYFFFLAFLPLQISTLAAWFTSRFILKNKK